MGPKMPSFFSQVFIALLVSATAGVLGNVFSNFFLSQKKFWENLLYVFIIFMKKIEKKIDQKNWLSEDGHSWRWSEAQNIDT
jgi:hypothetical protein